MGTVAGANYNFNVSSTVEGHEGESAYSQTLGGAFAVTTNALAIPFIRISGVTTNWVTDTEASIGWQVSKADPDDAAHHYVVATTNFPPFDLQQAVVTEGFEDTNQTGMVTALLTGLTPGTNYVYYVQSIIGYSRSYAATDLNGGDFHTFATQDGDPIPPVSGDAFPLTILTLPAADPVGATNAVVAWEFQSDTNTAHYVLFSPDTLPTPANAFIATAVPAPGNYCEVAFADLEGLPSGQTNFYFVQSVVNPGIGTASVMPMDGFYNWFVTGTNGGVGTSGDIVQSGGEVDAVMAYLNGAGGSNSGGSGNGSNGGGNTGGGTSGGGSNSGGNSGQGGSGNTGDSTSMLSTNKVRATIDFYIDMARGAETSGSGGAIITFSGPGVQTITKEVVYDSQYLPLGHNDPDTGQTVIDLDWYVAFGETNIFVDYQVYWDYRTNFPLRITPLPR